MTLNTRQSTFADRLNHALDIYGVPPKGKGRQIILGKMFNVSQKAASKWLEGKSYPKTKTLEIISKKLNVNLAWMLTGKGFINITTIPEENLFSQMKRIPLMAWTQAPYWNRITFQQNTRWSWANASIGPCAFSVQMIDDSMVPRYKKGDILTIDPELLPINRTIVIAQKQSGEIVCRQYLIDKKNNKTYLKPHNIKYKATLITQTSIKKIIGSVREVFMSLD